MASHYQYRAGPAGGLGRLLGAPVRDYVAALDAFLASFRVTRLAMAILALLLSWWIYVPVHELAHAFGCMLVGGEVTRLEIDPLYGAVLLRAVFPFVVAGSDYAGQLTGFDTHGSDLIYLATDFAPFVLTILAGVPMLRAAARADMGPPWRSVLFGAALPLAYAPFVSLPGDYYEAGSIIVTRASSWVVPGFAVERWRSDDVFRLVEGLRASGWTAGDALGVSASLAVGFALAWGTYLLGAAWARLLAAR